VPSLPRALRQLVALCSLARSHARLTHSPALLAALEAELRGTDPTELCFQRRAQVPFDLDTGTWAQFQPEIQCVIDNSMALAPHRVLPTQITFAEKTLAWFAREACVAEREELLSSERPFELCVGRMIKFSLSPAAIRKVRRATRGGVRQCALVSACQP